MTANISIRREVTARLRLELDRTGGGVDQRIAQPDLADAVFSNRSR